MQIMRWSYADLFALPAEYYNVLIKMLDDDAKEIEHQRALAEARSQRRR